MSSPEKKTMTKNDVEYVFCIGTGRNGSEYLQGLFSHVADCVAEHEPVPRCNRLPMRDFLSGRPERMRALMKEKLEQIQRSKKDSRVYVETNHCFIKGFGWLIPEYIDPEKIAVIVLSREKNKIAESYLRIGSTCLSENGRNWQIMPVKCGPLVPPPVRMISVSFTYGFFRFLAFPFRHKKYFKQLRIPRPRKVPEFILAYERECLEWYVEETQAMAEEYQKRFPQIRYYPMTIEDVNDPDKVAELLNSLGMEALPSMQEVVGVPTNLKR